MTDENTTLHDAVLEEIRIDWRAGCLRIGVGLVGGASGEIVADGLLMVRCPRREPWGSSAFINRVIGPGSIYADSHAVQLEIEMQSGDRIEIEARHIAVILG